MKKITKYLLIIGIGAFWCPVLAQVTETITIEGIHNSLYKDVETDDITATGSGYDIGRYLGTSGSGSTLDTTLNDISRTYYAFDVENVLSANNVTINSVKLFYRTIKSGESNFKITNTESFTKGINDLSENERGTYYNSIGNSSVLHQGLTYNGNGAIDSLTSVPIRTLLTSDLSKKVLYLGAFSQNESTDGSETSLILELKINYTYTAYNVTIRNDFNGSPNGGKVKASKNSAALVEYGAPYEIAVVNKDTINIGAKDNQVNGSYTWVFNDAEADNEKSRWMYDDGQTLGFKSNNQTTMHIANNDQNSTLFAEMKRLYHVTRQDQTELGTFTGYTYDDVVEGNTRNISAPSTKTVSGRTLYFVEWPDLSSLNQNQTVEPSGHTNYTALYKGSQISNNAGTFKASQRKVVHTSDGWQHLVYESMGHIWYEAKAPGGSWELVERQGNLHIDSNGGKSPSIDFNTYEFPNTYMTVVSWQEGVSIYYQVFAYASGEYIPYNWGYFPHGESSSSNVKPNVTFTDNGEFGIFWKSSAGIEYKIFDFDSPSNPIFGPIASGTISNTIQATNIAVSSSSNGTNDYYGIAWQEPMDEISGSPYYYGDEIKFVALRHIANASTATKLISNMRISPRYERPRS